MDDCRDKVAALKWCMALTPQKCDPLLMDLSQCFAKHLSI
jgi:hypothetical protein